MDIEDQLTSLKLSKKLFELGIKQDGLFYWCKPGPNSEYILNRCLFLDREFCQTGRHISAFTVAELGEMLPIKIKKYSLVIVKINIKDTEVWETGYEHNIYVPRFIEHKLSDSLARLLIYLLENKLIENK